MTRRVLVALSAGLLALGLPLAGAPALAQQADVEDTVTDAAQYPPADPAMVPGNPSSGSGDHSQFTHEVECISPNGSLPTDLQQTPWGQMFLRIDEAQRYATGVGQRVAVIDTGVSVHPRLAGRVEGIGDYIADANGLTDCDGHGTIVAGIIAAAEDPVTGFTGVAPDAEILSIRNVSHFYGPVDRLEEQAIQAGNLETMSRAIVLAADRGATVINLSETACVVATYPDDFYTAQLRAAINYAIERDIVVIAAAGNHNQDDPACANSNTPNSLQNHTFPGVFPEVLTVGSIGGDGALSEFSVQGDWVDIVAPGEDIISLDPAAGATSLANQVASPQGDLGPIEGTSFSAPYVAGVAALVRERYPDLSAEQVVNRLVRTAQHPGGLEGRSFGVGYGVLDPVAALTEVLPEEHGIEPAAPEQARNELPPMPPFDWTPTIVAVSGAGGGLVLLGITLFIVRAVRHTRQGSEA
ncbi:MULTISPECIES: type VII secretion-associated serine protease mycosin [Actinoalloteichus]|nr:MULTISPECIES: type VII secretion-associated serine protease mycosin [Actinoalloteichus]